MKKREKLRKTPGCLALITRYIILLSFFLFCDGEEQGKGLWEGIRHYALDMLNIGCQLDISIDAIPITVGMSLAFDRKGWVEDINL